MEEAPGQTVYLRLFLHIHCCYDVNAMIALPHSHAEVIAAALQVDKGDITAGIILCVIRVLQGDVSSGVDSLERANCCCGALSSDYSHRLDISRGVDDKRLGVKQTVLCWFFPVEGIENLRVFVLMRDTDAHCVVEDVCHSVYHRCRHNRFRIDTHHRALLLANRPVGITF